MSNNKQSSVEYLMDKLFDPSSMVEEQLEWFEQAKAMHKEEIDYKVQKAIEKFEEAKNQASTLRDMVYLDGVLSILDTIKNETYGGNK